MITTGSKFLIGSAVMATIATIVYGVTQDGVLGTVGLTSASVSLVVLAVLNVLLRDSNVFVDGEAPPDTSPAAQPAPSNSVWPLGMAFGAVVVAVGLVSYQTITVVGLVVVLVAGAEWAVTNWADRASGDPGYNASVRSRLSNPLEFPVGGAVAIGIIVYSFSRIMLWLSKTNTVVAFGVVALVVLAIAFTFASKPSIKSGAIGATVAIGAVAIVATGAAAGLDGERDIHVFETTSAWQAEALADPAEYVEGAALGEHPGELICESPEEFPEADEDVSQTVGAKSGSYQIFLTEDGRLAFDVPGPIQEGIEGITLPRSTPTNIIFRNDYDEHARLSVDLGTIEVTDEETGEVVPQPQQICTTLIEPGAAELMTLTVGAPSMLFAGVPNANGPGVEDADGYWFFVPGVDTAKLELIVP